MILRIIKAEVIFRFSRKLGSASRVPKSRAEADNANRGFDNSRYHAKTEFNDYFIIHIRFIPTSYKFNYFILYSGLETRRCELKSRSRQRIFRCRLQCQININLVFHISEDGSEIELKLSTLDPVLERT